MRSGVNKHGMGPWIRSLMISLLVTALALGAPMSSVSAQEAVDARIQALERQMEEMRARSRCSPWRPSSRLCATPPPAIAAPTPAPAEPPSVVRDQSPEETITTTEEATEPVVSSSQPEVKVSLSGQVNRAINFANDGDSTKAYFVDNDVSNSRFRVLGLANYNEDVRFGGLLEVAFSPNNSSDVSQDNEDADDLIDVRRAETGVDSKRWGGSGSAKAAPPPTMWPSTISPAST